MHKVLIYITMQLMSEIIIHLNVLNVNKSIFYNIIIIDLHNVDINVGRHKRNDEMDVHSGHVILCSLYLSVREPG